MGQLYCKRDKEYRVLMQGLDGAGKTTLLYRMKLGEAVKTTKTLGFNLETVSHRNVSFETWDIGGRSQERPLFRHYYQNTDVLVYVVDSTDAESMGQVMEEMDRILQLDAMQGVPMLVFANKQDLPKALSVETITEKLHLTKLTDRPWYIVPCVATTGDGLFEGFDWLSAAINNTDVAGRVSFKEVLTAPTGSSYLHKGLEYMKNILTT